MVSNEKIKITKNMLREIKRLEQELMTKDSKRNIKAINLTIALLNTHSDAFITESFFVSHKRKIEQ